MIITEGYALSVWWTGNDAGLGYAPYTNDARDSTIEEAVRCAVDLDGWGVVLRCQDGLVVLERGRELMGIGGAADGGGAWAVNLGAETLALDRDLTSEVPCGAPCAGGDGAGEGVLTEVLMTTKTTKGVKISIGDKATVLSSGSPIRVVRIARAGARLKTGDGCEWAPDRRNASRWSRYGASPFWERCHVLRLYQVGDEERIRVAQARGYWQRKASEGEWARAELARARKAVEAADAATAAAKQVLDEAEALLAVAVGGVDGVKVARAARVPQGDDRR